MEMLFRNLVAGNLAASRVRYWLIRLQRGMLGCGQGKIAVCKCIYIIYISYAQIRMTQQCYSLTVHFRGLPLPHTSEQNKTTPIYTVSRQLSLALVDLEQFTELQTAETACTVSIIIIRT